MNHRNISACKLRVFLMAHCILNRRLSSALSLPVCLNIILRTIWEAFRIDYYITKIESLRTYFHKRHLSFQFVCHRSEILRLPHRMCISVNSLCHQCEKIETISYWKWDGLSFLSQHSHKMYIQYLSSYFYLLSFLSCIDTNSLSVSVIYLLWR